jgi:hypothetical protein
MSQCAPDAKPAENGSVSGPLSQQSERLLSSLERLIESQQSLTQAILDLASSNSQLAEAMLDDDDEPTGSMSRRQ